MSVYGNKVDDLATKVSVLEMEIIIFVALLTVEI